MCRSRNEKCLYFAMDPLQDPRNILFMAADKVSVASKKGFLLILDEFKIKIRKMANNQKCHGI